MSRSRLIALLLALVTLLVYLPVTHHEFVNYDDGGYVTENSTVKAGLSWHGVKWAFTTWVVGNWHPVTMLSHMADCQFFGLNSGMHHYENVLFHAANAALLFFLLLKMTNRRNGNENPSPANPSSIWPCAFVAALFAWHPLHVESVAWLAERKDVLSTFFELLALLFFVQSVEKSKGEKRKANFFYGLAIFMFALGLMSKPMPVTMPFVMLLLDFWPLQRFNDSTVRRLLVEKIPFFLLAAIFCGVTFWSQHGSGAVVAGKGFPFHLRLDNALISYGRYLLKMIWPVDLAVIYPLSFSLRSEQPLAAAMVLGIGVISLIAWRTRKKNPYLFTGWFWYLGTLMPVIGLVQVGGASMADRYSYFPLVGIFIVIAFGARDLVVRFQLPKILPALTIILFLAACVALTERQLACWQNSITLFEHALAVTRDNDIAHANLGVALQAKGDKTAALANYREALRIWPANFEMHNNIGNLLDEFGKPEEAVAEYRKAIALNPSLPFLHNSLGGALAELGRFPEAMAEFTNAMRLDPDYYLPHVRLGDALLKQGRDTEAVAQFNDAMRLAPLDYQTLIHTAFVLAAIDNSKVRDGKTALILAVKANVLSGGNQPFVFDVLGMAFAENGDFSNAQTCAQNALILANAAKMKKLEPIQKRLELYKNHQPWRESFRATNAPPGNLPKN